MVLTTTTSIWQDVSIPSFEPFRGTAHFDVVVIGGGVTGLSATYFLKKAGVNVCLLERGRLCEGDTGHTTAHLTCVTDVRLGELASKFGRDEAALTWYAGLTGLELIEQIVSEHEIDCEFHRTPAFLHSSLESSRDDTSELRDESELACELGFDAEFVGDVPIVHKAGMLLRNQAKLHPLAYMAGLAAVVQGSGGVIFEQSEVTQIEEDPLVVVTDDARINCDFVVVATHVPLAGKANFLKATLLQSRLAAYSTYVVGGMLQGDDSPDVSLWDTSDPYYYLRVDRHADASRVVFGGCDHKTGQQTDGRERFRHLEDLLRGILRSVAISHRWSGQVIKANDGLPLIGETASRQFVATGYNGNGITFGTLAGAMARDAFLGKENPWQDLFSPTRKTIRGGAWNYVKENVDYPYYLLADRLQRPTSEPATLKPGEGAIVKIDGRRIARARDEQGTLHQVSAICTHLGCAVRWNTAEHTWDCPCHGSRFRVSGEVIAGPAESPLESLDTLHSSPQR